MEKKYAAKVKSLTDKDMAAMEEKLQVLLSVMLNQSNQSNTGIDMGDLGAFLSTRNDDNNVRHSSTSTYAPNNHKVCFPYIEVSANCCNRDKHQLE